MLAGLSENPQETVSFPVKEGFKQKSSLETSPGKRNETCHKQVEEPWNPRTLQQQLAIVIHSM